MHPKPLLRLHTAPAWSIFAVQQKTVPTLVYKRLIFTFFIAVCTLAASAQCSICTKTAQQLGDKPAKGLNAGILYLAAAPLLLMGAIGYQVYRQRKADDQPQ